MHVVVPERIGGEVVTMRVDDVVVRRAARQRLRLIDADRSIRSDCSESPRRNGMIT
jgi:hypothetical protein